MKERLQKILAARGLASRRQAEAWILAGRVTCNGTKSSLGDSADAEQDIICLDGIPIPSKQNHIYIMLNKPRGYVTTLSDERGRKNVSQLVSDCGARVYPVGRLDMDSEGLLILTNDGAFANLLMHPKHEIDKRYLVNVRGYTPNTLERVSRPIMLDGYRIRKPEVTLIGQDPKHEGSAQLEITIHEGRNRQVRRMCAVAGMQVVRLKRISEGNVVLGSLPVGKWRHLTQKEITSLCQGF